MRYDAFISYRHSDLDMYIAKKIHKGLETFKVPRAVAKKTGKKNIKRVFRDQEELPIGSDLGDNIESALAESEYLLVICSPRTPESYWVQKEISTFIQMHGREHVLAVLIEGEPDESFPEQLLIDDEGNPVEPLAADVRGATKREMNKKMKTEIMRLAAPLLHCSYDDLRQRHRERKMRRIAALSAAVAGLAVLFGAYNAYNAAMIQQNLEGKQRNQSKYLADTSLTLLSEGDRRAAVLVALEALPSEENERPYVAEAQYALSQALHSYDTGSAMKMDRVLTHDLPVSEFRFNEEGTRVASIDQGENIYVWDVSNGEKLAQIPPQIKESGHIDRPVAACVYGEQIIICNNDTLRSLSFDGEETWTVTIPGGASYCDFLESAQTVACVNRDQVVFFDITSGEQTGIMPNKQEASYSGEMAFSDDMTKFAVSHYISDDTVTEGCVSVYDFTTGEVTDVKTATSYITDIAFTSDDCIVVTLSNGADFFNFGQNEVTGHIHKMDYRSGEILWQDSYEFLMVGNEAASTQIKCRKYENADTGETHDEVMMSVDNYAYTWDNATGERLSVVQVDGGIADLLVASSSGFGFLAQYDGTVDIIDTTSGTRYSSSAIETGKEIRQLAIKNGVLVCLSYASPDMTLMKYPQNENAVELNTYGDSVDELEYSKEESYYAVNVYDFDVNNRVYFYRTEDNSLVREWVDEEGSSVVATGFVSDGEYVVMSYDGTLRFCDVETGEMNSVSLGENFGITEYDCNEDMTLALGYYGGWYSVIDLEKQEVLYSGDTEGYIYGAILSEDGSRIYCSMKDRGLCIIDVSTGVVTPIELPGYQVLSGSEMQDTFAASNNGKLLAVGCTDGRMRVLDVEAMETVAEIPFTGVYRSFIRFSDDDTKLMMQGDDYYFRVYDLEKDAFGYISTNQYYEIENMVVDEQSDTLSLITMIDMVILNREDFERTAQVEGGKAYLPGHGRIYTEYYDTLYQFPYMTLEMLQEEAQKQFGGEELTEFERIKYNVE